MITGSIYDEYGIMGLLNSKLLRYYWEQKFEDKRKDFPKIKGTYLELLPIKAPTTKLIEISKQITKKASNNESVINEERSLNLIVFHLYNLSYDDIIIVDPETSITQSEYESFNPDEL